MRFDFEAIFGDDYLHFHGPRLTDEVSDQDAEDIVRFLGLQPGARVLDAPCGHGRISSRLAARGMDVVGVDASELFLEVARSQGDGVEYVQGDIRALPVDGPFDVVLSWFTSFGYFEDDENRQVLREYRRVLRPGGRLLLEGHNHDELVRRFVSAPFGAVTEVGDELRVETSTWDCVEGRTESDWVIVRDGETRRAHLSVRIPTIPELRVWLLDAGFSSVDFFARDGGEPSLTNPRLVTIATA